MASTASFGSSYAATGVTITDAGVMRVATNVASNALIGRTPSVTGASTPEEAVSGTSVSTL